MRWSEIRGSFTAAWAEIISCSSFGYEASVWVQTGSDWVVVETGWDAKKIEVRRV